MNNLTTDQLKAILEAAILAAGEPINFERLRHLFDEHERPATEELRAALVELASDCVNRGIELKELASGFCFQAKAELGGWIKRLWQEKPPRYSRAFLETLAVIAYRQPITRGDIEEIRGVAVSTNIIKILLEREWIRVVGQREVPGRPSLYATTRQFLDHFNLKTLEDLPVLTESQDLDQVALQLENQFSEVLANDEMISEEIVASEAELEGSNTENAVITEIISVEMSDDNEEVIITDKIAAEEVS